MLVDSHAHLDEGAVAAFVGSIKARREPVLVLSNSVDMSSSLRNLEIAKTSQFVKAFVGLHPEVFSKFSGTRADIEGLISEAEEIAKLYDLASGIGEIGLDPKYGFFTEQKKLLQSILASAERTALPVSIHSRESVTILLDLISTYDIRGKILFHWFAGSEQDFAAIQDRGYYSSFGPSILFSNRLSRLVEKGDLHLILPETDSPTPYRSLVDGPSSPDLVASVEFKIALLRKLSFEDACIALEKNIMIYLGTQN